MATSVAQVNAATDFLQYLTNNPDKRQQLQDASAADIVQAGKDAGYDFTENDLDVLLNQTGGLLGPTPSMCWDEIPDCR